MMGIECLANPFPTRSGACSCFTDPTASAVVPHDGVILQTHVGMRASTLRVLECVLF